MDDGAGAGAAAAVAAEYHHQWLCASECIGTASNACMRKQCVFV